MKNSLLKLLSISLIVVSSTPSQAYDSVLLQKGVIAPFEGVLFSVEDAGKLRVELLEKETYQLLNESYKKSFNLVEASNKLKDEQFDLVMKRNLDLTKALNSQKDMNDWEKFMWFGLGILTSTLTVYGIKNATK